MKTKALLKMAMILNVVKLFTIEIQHKINSVYSLGHFDHFQ